MQLPYHGRSQGGILAMVLKIYHFHYLLPILPNLQKGRTSVEWTWWRHRNAILLYLILLNTVTTSKRNIIVFDFKSHGIIFNCNKTVCMTFKAKSAKSTATPVLKLGGQYVKTVDQYKYLGMYWILSSQMTKTFRDNCDVNIVQQTSCEPLFPVAQLQ